MTRAAGIPKIIYDGNDVAENFSFPYVFWDDTDLKVMHRDEADTETLLVLDTDYTVNGGDGAVGDIDFPKVGSSFSTLATGESLAIKSNIPEQQATDLDGTFDFKTVNLTHDQIVTMIQQNSEEIERSSRYKLTNPDTPPDLETILAGIPGSGFALKDSFGFYEGVSGVAIASGQKDFRPVMSRSGTISKITTISIVNGAKTAKTIKARLLKNGVNVSGTDYIFLDSASKEIKTSFTGWTLGFVAGDEFQLDILSSPTPTAEVITVSVEVNLV